MTQAFKLADFAPSSADVLTHISATRVQPGPAGLAILANIAYNHVKEQATARLYATIRSALDDALDLFPMVNGDRPEGGPEADEWDSAADDVVAEVFEPFASILSANTLYAVTVDTRVHEDNARERLAKRFAEDAWRVLTWLPSDEPGELGKEKTPMQVLSAVGVVRGDLETLIDMQPHENVSQPQQEPTTVTDMYALFPKIVAHLGDGFKAAPLRSEFELLVDTDDGLAAGAARRLGMTLAEAEPLREIGRRPNGVEWLVQTTVAASTQPAAQPAAAEAEPETSEDDELAAMLGTTEAEPETDDDDELAAMLGDVQTAPQGSPPAASPPVFGEPPAVTTGAPPKPRKRRGAVDPNTPGAIPARALQILKEYTPVKSDVIGEGIGVARATFEGYAKGRSVLIADDDQRAFLLNLVRTHKAAMEEAETLLATDAQ